MSLSRMLTDYIRAGFTGIWITSHEHEDAIGEIIGLCRQENWRLATWDIDQGLRRSRVPSEISGRVWFRTGHIAALGRGRSAASFLVDISTPRRSNAPGASVRPRLALQHRHLGF